MTQARLGTRVKDKRARRAARICLQCDRADFHAATCPLRFPLHSFLNPQDPTPPPVVGAAPPPVEA